MVTELSRLFSTLHATHINWIKKTGLVCDATKTQSVTGSWWLFVILILICFQLSQKKNPLVDDFPPRTYIPVSTSRSTCAATFRKRFVPGDTKIVLVCLLDKHKVFPFFSPFWDGISWLFYEYTNQLYYYAYNVTFQNIGSELKHISQIIRKRNFTMIEQNRSRLSNKILRWWRYEVPRNT